MGIKLDEKTKTFTVSYSKRHPKTRRPYNARRIKIKSKVEAKRIYNELVLQVEARIHKVSVPDWRDLVEKFLDDFSRRDYSKKTVETYRLCLVAHTLSEWGNLSIDKIDGNMIRNIIKRKLSNRSQSHQKNNLKYIRAVFNFAVEAGYLLRNPTPQMKFQIGNKLKDVLTEEQARYFLNKAKEVNSEWYPIWAMALYTGLRNGELYALTWDKVNLEDRLIKVDCSWNSKDGYKSTKSGDDRIIEIAPNLLFMLKELKLSNVDSNFVLPRIDRWDKGLQAHDLRLFLTAIGLPRIRFHDLRASWATMMLSKGIEPIRVMSMGGWRELKTLQVYIRKAGVNIRGITDCLDIHNPTRNETKVLQF